VITMPRIISIGPDGFLRQQPAPEFETLRGEAKTFTARELGEKPLVLDGVPGDATEIEAEFTGNGAFGFELRRSPEGKPGVVVSIQRGNLTVGDVRSYVGNATRYQIRIFLDKRCMEVFVNDGVAAVYHSVEAPRENQGIAVFAQAGGFGGRGGMGAPGGPPPGATVAGSANRPAPAPIRIESLKVWPMKPAKFSMEHFHV